MFHRFRQRGRKVRTAEGTLLPNGQDGSGANRMRTASATESKPPMAPFFGPLALPGTNIRPLSGVSQRDPCGGRAGTGDQVRVKRQGKSLPAVWVTNRLGKPQGLQNQIGRRWPARAERAARPSRRVGCLRLRVTGVPDK